MIRSSKHHIKDLNKNKKERYILFLKDYHDYTYRVIDSIWRNGYKDFSIKNNCLVLPKYIDYKDFNFKTDLSARARSNAVYQASQIIRSCVEKQKRVLWVRENKNRSVKDKNFSKPKISNIYPNLSSKNCDVLFCKGKFAGFIKLKSLGKKYGDIKIPISKNTRYLNEKLMSGILFTDKYITLTFDVEQKENCGNNIVGVDQGLNTVVTLSNGKITPNECNHGHTLNSIIDKVSRKKRGSKAQKRAIQHRTNFVNWSINQLDLSNIKEIKLEKINNIRFRKKTSKKMSHWSNPEIVDKLKSRCEELKVLVTEQSCVYRSQRCSQCGQVRKSNRKSKIYSCKNCGYSSDADYNASLNHLVDLPEVHRDILVHRLNLGNGFLWMPEGFFNLDGSELRVPNSQN